MTHSMKSRVVLAIFAGFVLCGITAWADPPSQVGRLSLISGNVSFLPGSLNEWTPATLNYPLTSGDHLWTDPGARAEVHVLSAAIRLNYRVLLSEPGRPDGPDQCLGRIPERQSAKRRQRDDL